MKFLRKPTGYLEFSTKAARTLVAARQIIASSPESGGMLVGRLVLNSADVVVDEVTVPTTQDRRGRYFFRRAKRAAQEKIDRFWKESNKTANYLGEWHTHSEGIPSPSMVDLENWRHITRMAVYEQSGLFFVIVGIEKIRVWESSKATGNLTELPEFDLPPKGNLKLPD